MADSPEKVCVYTIPHGLPFLDLLAKGILDETEADFAAVAKMRILLPSRRAARSLRESFLRLTQGKPLLLPRMHPIADIDEDELSLTLSGTEDELSLPPAISPLRRRFLLARLIAGIDGRSRGVEQDMMLADALGRLLDQVYTEDLDLARLPDIVDRAEFSSHWQVSIDFLKILSEFWPKILLENGVIDAADRRNRLIKSLAHHWKTSPPAERVIAAGSTGSIPASAELLRTVAAMPGGCIILPGLDQTMDEESWKNVDDTHPQASLKDLLKTLDTERASVALWPACQDQTENGTPQRHFLSEIMRPAETTEEWQNLREHAPFAPENVPVERYDCANPQEEALVVAMVLRQALEDPERTAALVTPDRKLARRVAMACRRWGIEIDDSAGQPLANTRVGTYLRLCLEACCADMKPVALLDFCKHTLCLPSSRTEWRGDIRALDLYAFRGPAFRGGLEVYRQRIKELKAEKIKAADKSALFETLNVIEQGFEPFLNDFDRRSLSEWCSAHIATAEYFCDPALLWSGQDGEAASLLFTELREQEGLLPDLTAEEYLSVLVQIMHGIAVRPLYGLHPRLAILGLMEARLIGADMVILSGLNEGTWPPAPAIDPWMSRPMRRRFGLPSPERAVGLAAHDFAQGLCAPSVVLTWSLRTDGSPTVPARWLERMDTVLRACGVDPLQWQGGPVLDWARTIDHSDSFTPVSRPEPRPPVQARPRQLPVTRIEQWMNDPYSIYANYVLNLRKLPPLEQTLDAAMRGTLIHAALDRFILAWPDNMPDEAAQSFITIAREELDALGLEDDVRSFWMPRLARIGQWLVREERKWRADYEPSLRETRGTMSIPAPAGDFVLTARADRIDTGRDGSGAAIIDYKSAGAFSAKGLIEGKYPQLPLEALILEGGGFGARQDVSALAYWVVQGGRDSGKITLLASPTDLEESMNNARDGLQKLIAAFDREETPYYSLPRMDRAPRFNDYEHLARVREWTVLDEGEAA